MILGIEKEIAVFLQALLAGNLIYLVYTAIRIFRRIVKHNLFWVSVEDMVFWVTTGFYLFLEMYQTSNGSIRWYFVLGIFAGGLFTHHIILRIAKKNIENSKKRE